MGFKRNRQHVTKDEEDKHHEEVTAVVPLKRTVSRTPHQEEDGTQSHILSSALKMQAVGNAEVVDVVVAFRTRALSFLQKTRDYIERALTEELWMQLHAILGELKMTATFGDLVSRHAEYSKVMDAICKVEPYHVIQRLIRHDLLNLDISKFESRRHFAVACMVQVEHEASSHLLSSVDQSC